MLSSSYCAMLRASRETAVCAWLAQVGSGASAPTPVPVPQPNATNTMTVANVIGAVQANYPLQFGRPFTKGEIPNYPQAVINGTPVTTQADVKTRYPDGSVKHAILALLVPSIPVSGNLAMTFVDQANGNNTPMSKSAMLAYDFDATMALSFTSGVTGSASARAMLTADDYKLWTSGQIAQTIELADDTTARKYDIGNGDGFRPLRPRFYATFWSGGRVQVRIVGENGLSTEIEDLRYTLSLTIGSAAPTPAYSIDLTGGTNGKIHWGLTSWAKTFWIGGEPEEKVNIDHNLAYLTSTRFFPNYDTSVVVPESTMVSRFSNFNSHANDLYDGSWNLKGWWTGGMSSPGARDEIGPIPTWTMHWLYTGDWRMRRIALKQADLAGAFPATLRETDSTKRLLRTDPAGSGTGLGRMLSVTDRKTVCLYTQALFSWTNTVVSDRVKVVGPLTQKFTLDGAHQYAPFYAQYVLTGDPWYLSQMLSWAGISAARYTAGQRGLSGTGGGIADELRGHGWVMGRRADAAVAAPDASPEKAYLTTLMNDALAMHEGFFGITGTGFDGTAIKVEGANRGDPLAGKPPPPLRNWESGGNAGLIQENETNGIFQVGKVGSFTSPWMQHYVQLCLGHIAELGFASGALRDYSGQWIIGLILDSGNPHLLAVYQLPVGKAGGGYFTWIELLTDALTATYINTTLAGAFAGAPTPEAYQLYVAGGLAALVDAGTPRADLAWAWYRSNVYNRLPAASAGTNPKWTIVPRT